LTAYDGYPVTDQKSVGAHFDDWAPSYDAQIREMVPGYEQIHETLLALLALRPPGRFLDLGAGTIYTLRRVLDAFPDVTAVGLDVSSEMLDRARQRLGDLDARVELRSSDIAEPVIDGKFDAIVPIRRRSTSPGSRQPVARPSTWSGRPTMSGCSSPGGRRARRPLPRDRGCGAWQPARRRSLPARRPSPPRGGME